MTLFEHVWTVAISKVRNFDRKSIRTTSVTFCLGMFVGGAGLFLCIAAYLVINIVIKAIIARINTMLKDTKIKTRYEDNLCFLLSKKNSVIPVKEEGN